MLPLFRKQLLLLFLFSGLFTALSAQKYGNEWIDPSRPHAKIRVWKDGVFRVGYFSLEAAYTEGGAFIGAIPLDKFRLFNMGQEVPIYIYDQNGNNRLDIVDYIEFVGHPLDGRFDTELYENPGHQRHTLQSMVTDTNYYYFTDRSTGSPLRYTTYGNITPPDSPLREWHLYEDLSLETRYYSVGTSILVGDKEALESEYRTGEGFFGESYYANGDSSRIAYMTAFDSRHYVSSGPPARIEANILGTSGFYGKNSHWITLKLGPSLSNFRRVFDTVFTGPQHFNVAFNLKQSDVGTDKTYFLHNPKLLPGVGFSAYGHSFTRFIYPHDYNLGDSINWRFYEDSSVIPQNIEWSAYGDGIYHKPVVYDEVNLLRIPGTFTQAGKKVNYVLPPLPRKGKMILTDGDAITNVPDMYVHYVEFSDQARDIDSTQYIIVTSPELIGPKGEVFDYVNVWRTLYATRLKTTAELYDAFSYGIPHPLAIRHYCRYLLEKGNNPAMKPRYLLLLGRGFDMMYNRGVYYDQTKKHQWRNHIPAIGSPVSDYMYTSGLDGTTLEPALATGRVPADVPADIGKYLIKLKQYMGLDNQYQDWQKRVLHLGGGATTDQAYVIRDRLKTLEPVVQRDPFAGFVTTYSKTASGTVQADFKTRILNDVNSGVNLMTFLGHGSTSVTDIDVGEPDKYLNQGKYPICYFNGCQVGNPCVPIELANVGLGEKMFRADQKGAVAFLGQTYLSELFMVSSQMGSFYNSYFDTIIGKGLGDVVKNSIKGWQQPWNPLNRAHCRQLFLQGDPALPVYAPTRPDPAINNTSIFFEPENFYALSDSFQVGIVISNFGRGFNDSFDISMTRVYPDGVTKRNYVKRWRMHGFQDTAYITVKSKDILTRGDNNLFYVELNPTRTLVEHNYDNNKAFVKRYVAGNGVNLIYPSRFAIIGTDSVELTVQSSDLFKEREDFYLEIDTTPWFNSPLLISRSKPSNNPLTAGLVARWKVPLKSVRDTQPYFWRARIAAPFNEGGAWVSSSFTAIKNHGEGWMQNLHWQMGPRVSNNENTNVVVDSAENRVRFSKVLKKIYIDAQYGPASNTGVKEAGFASQDMNYGVGNNGLVAIPWDGRKLERTPLDTSKIWPDWGWGRAWRSFGYHVDYMLYYSFPMNTKAGRDRFVQFVNAMPDSSYVTIYTRYQSFADEFTPDVLAAFNKIGSVVFDTSGNRVADAMYVGLGRKGWAPGQAQEAITAGKLVPYVQIEGEMIGDAAEGTMLSERIGTTNRFQDLFFYPITSKAKGENDKFTIDVLGQGSNGKTDVIYPNVSSSPLNLQTIPTGQYKFLQLRARFSDDGNRTAPNLYNWRIAMDEVPEGTIYPEKKIGYKFYSDTLYEGDSLRVVLPFRNISKVPFRDSLRLDYTISHKITRAVLESGYIMYPALKPEEYFVFTKKLSTVGLAGLYGLQVNVNPQYLQPERNLSNNSALLNFFVTKDVVNPLLDVTFDGVHIVNGDIVSANPEILITSKDENPFRLQQDSNNMELHLLRPGSSAYEKITFGTEAIYYPAQNKTNRARIEYRPKDLPSGEYKMKVQSRDASSNKAAVNEYEIGFVVDRNQTVTHFYPYPNPFTSSMRFVFTLTGTKVPEDIRVKIMTADGRVVKEVNKDDLGNIHVGNNITDWTWDGTDQYGDKLGNGTYFYKVTVQDGGEDVKLRASKGDSGFKEQVGVIYLMR
ncbi:MAG: hypothetical protein JNL57_10915 [Bacteroidetes bacterium]|nr:hypothetical protein [Bacteroidota bacterium]